MSSNYQREYLLRLPMPLAQQYSAAFNGRTESARTSAGWSTLEQLIGLAAAALVACYVKEAGAGQARCANADRVLSRMRDPSDEDWMLLVSALSQHFGTRGDSATHPLGHLYAQLNDPRTDLPGLSALYAWTMKSIGDEPADATEFTLRRALHAAADYRQKQSASTAITVAEQDVDSVLLPALNELLAEGQLDVLGRAGTKLIWIEDVKMLDEHQSEVSATELVGIHGERIESIMVPASQATLLVPQRVALLWPGRPAPLPLDPMLHFQEGELRAEVLFYRRSTADFVQMHSFISQEDIKQPGLLPSMARLMSGITGNFMDQSPVATLHDPEPAEVLRDLERDEIRIRLLEQPGSDDLPSQWEFTTTDMFTIGREKSNDVIVLNPRVSRQHAVVSFDGQRWQYENKGSNGTLLSGERVDRFAVHDGMIAQLAASGPRVQFDLGSS